VAIDAPDAGIFRIGGDLPVHRLGFGALRITGPGHWGDPPDRAAALTLLRRLPGLGINLVDTADSYGPETSEQLIREALHPYDGGLIVATKGGYTRPRPGAWVPLGRPEYLMQSARLSARRLGVETIALWQLHRIDPAVPRDEQFDAIRQLRQEGVIRHVGLSEVDIAEIEAAQAYFPVATVQNRYNLADRTAEPILDYCEGHGIGFIPFFPLGAGALAKSDDLQPTAARLGVTAPQLALAWLLERSAVMLPIPGASSLPHVADNAAAAAIRLSQDDLDQISAISETLRR
jgi:aryl-alcohol dehydrogenase-like predicted oxidoreductase